MTQHKPQNWLIAAALTLSVAAAGYWAYNQPDKRSDSEKLSDALGEVSQGFENAAKEFEDKTLGEKLQEDLKAASEEIHQDIVGSGDSASAPAR